MTWKPCHRSINSKCIQPNSYEMQDGMVEEVLQLEGPRGNVVDVERFYRQISKCFDVDRFYREISKCC